MVTSSFVPTDNIVEIDKESTVVSGSFDKGKRSFQFKFDKGKRTSFYFTVILNKDAFLSLLIICWLVVRVHTQ